MKDIILAFFVLVLIAAAGAVLYRVATGGCSASPWPLGFAGGALLLAIGLAVPMRFKGLVDTVSSAKLPKLGGTP